MPIVVGEKLQIYNPNTNERFCVDITAENIDRIRRYDNQAKTDADWRFGDQCSGDVAPPATISFTEDNGLLKIDVVPSVVDEEVLNWQQQMNGRGRRSRKVKKSKSSKKNPTARRRRSSKARRSRKARKARSTRRR